MAVAYVYLPKEKKYDKIDITLLTNFDYEVYKCEDREQCATKVYKGKTIKGKKFKCQILHVADSLQELECMIKRKRIRVPKLNQSILDSSTSIQTTDYESDIITEKNKRKLNKKLQSNVRSETQDKIMEDFYGNDSSENTTFEKTASEDNTTNDDIHAHSLQKKIANMEEQITELRKQYNEEKEKADLYHSKYKHLKHWERFPLAEKAEQNIINLTKKYRDTEEKTINQPVHNMMHETEEDETVNLDNEVHIKESAFEMAYSCYDPSKFVITLCYSIWGYEKLANRYVKRVTNKEGRQIVTPTKVEVLRTVFKDWLMKNGYQKQACRNELKRMNIFINRAITGARRHLKLDVPKTPDVQHENTRTDVQHKNTRTEENNAAEN